MSYVRRNYTRASLERALIYHGIQYSPPGAGQPSWRVNTHLGTEIFTAPQVYAYVMGLAHYDHVPRRTAACRHQFNHSAEFCDLCGMDIKEIP